MSWHEIVVDNGVNQGLSSKRSCKAFIMLYHSPDLNFYITARFHDGHFKYYLDCEQADIYERWFGVPGVDNKDSIRLRGLRLISGSLNRQNLRAFIELRKAEQEFNRGL